MKFYTWLHNFWSPCFREHYSWLELQKYTLYIFYSTVLLKYDQLLLKNIPSYGIRIFTELSFICLLITLENQMMEDGTLCILKLFMSIIQNCFNIHNVLTDLAQWGPIAAVTAIWTYTTSLVTCSFLCTLSTYFPTVLAIGTS